MIKIYLQLMMNQRDLFVNMICLNVLAAYLVKFAFRKVISHESCHFTKNVAYHDTFYLFLKL